MVDRTVREDCTWSITQPGHFLGVARHSKPGGTLWKRIPENKRLAIPPGASGRLRQSERADVATRAVGARGGAPAIERRIGRARTSCCARWWRACRSRSNSGLPSGESDPAVAPFRLDRRTAGTPGSQSAGRVPGGEWGHCGRRRLKRTRKSQKAVLVRSRPHPTRRSRCGGRR
jgi:hypothetical protein